MKAIGLRFRGRRSIFELEDTLKMDIWDLVKVYNRDGYWSQRKFGREFIGYYCAYC